MSTEDVPGYRPENRDKLAMGSWAEHADGSLIVVESTEGGRVIYSIFDTEQKPIMEFRDAMAAGAFNKQYSWTPEKKRGKDDAWTWHDKTPFPWDRIIAAGARPGPRYADVEDQLSEAERIKERRTRQRTWPEYEELPNAAQRARRARDIQKGSEVDVDDLTHRFEHLGEVASRVLSRLQAAISRQPTKRKRS